MVTETAYFDVATNYGNMSHAQETMEDFLDSSSSRRNAFRNSSRSFSTCSTYDGLSPPLGRIRRHSSRFSNSFSETAIMPEMHEIQGDATLCFDEEGTCFQGVIVAHDDGSHYSIQGKKTQRLTAQEGVLSCGCDDTKSDGEDESGVRVSFDIRIKDHDNPMEHHLQRVHGRNGQVCRFTCSNVNFTSVEVFRGHKADMIAQSCLGNHQIHCGRSTVYRGPMSISVKSKETPRHWVL